MSQSLQKDIDSIVNAKKTSSKEKIRQLNELFSHKKMMVFCDFDDTITNNNNLYYSKVKYIKKRKLKQKYSLYGELLSQFTINDQFLKIAQKNNLWSFVIISRNSHDFIGYAVEYAKELFAEHGITIDGYVGRTDSFSFETPDKLVMMPSGATIVSDIFEYPTLRNYKYFLSVDENNSYLRRLWITFTKIFYLLAYIVRHV